jgi:hypothetical protein
MPKPAPRFIPHTIEEVFAIFLARELDDVSRIRLYASLVRKFSLCVLLNSLRQARKEAGAAEVDPAHFLAALETLSEENTL